MILNPFPTFAAFRYSPTIPAIYWNVESPEQAFKQLALHYDKIVAYLDAMVDTINSQYQIVTSLQDELPSLVETDVNDYLDRAFADPSSDLYQLVNETVTQWANDRTAQVDAIQDVIDSLTVGTTYGELKDHGFVYIVTP